MQPAASSWSFEQDDLNAITRTISRFLAETGARSALLADRSGHLVTLVGEPPTFDPTTFATLTAADFSAISTCIPSPDRSTTTPERIS